MEQQTLPLARAWTAGSIELPAGSLVSASIETALGPMLAVAAADRVCLLEFADRRMLPTQLKRVQRRFRSSINPGRAGVFDQLEAELGEYFAGSRRSFDTLLATVGSPWQEACWTVLRSIQYGATISYAEGAAAAGRRDSNRAFGRANGDNRLAILVPCHRVVGTDGALTGYGGGLWRKAALLELEGAAQR
jgi:AraC family transcriptional regulator, regulatory protein of adaptative response / methylated-DNA-[protein]-cysteine methyltransferase